jgi:hypothetical protein
VEAIGPPGRCKNTIIIAVAAVFLLHRGVLEGARVRRLSPIRTRVPVSAAGFPIGATRHPRFASSRVGANSLEDNAARGVVATRPYHGAVPAFGLAPSGGGRRSASAPIVPGVVPATADLPAVLRPGINEGGGRAASPATGTAIAMTVGMLPGVRAGLAGIAFSFYIAAGRSLAAFGVERDTMAAMVVGGMLLTGGQGSVIGRFIGVAIQGLIRTCINFDGTLSRWWTRKARGTPPVAFVALQQARAADRKPLPRVPRTRVGDLRSQSAMRAVDWRAPRTFRDLRQGLATDRGLRKMGTRMKLARRSRPRTAGVVSP